MILEEDNGYSSGSGSGSDNNKSNNHNTKDGLQINCDEQLLSSTLWAKKNNNKDVKDGQLYMKKFEMLKRQSMQHEAKKQMKILSTQQNTTLPFSLRKIGEKKGKKSASSDNENNSSGDHNSSGEHTPINVNGSGSDNNSSSENEEEELSKVNEIRSNFENKPYLKLKHQCITERGINKGIFRFEPLKLIHQNNNTPQQSKMMSNAFSFAQGGINQRNLFGNSPSFGNGNGTFHYQQSPCSSNNSANYTYSGGNNINLSTQTSSNNPIRMNRKYINSEPYDDLREK